MSSYRFDLPEHRSHPSDSAISSPRIEPRPSRSSTRRPAVTVVRFLRCVQWSCARCFALRTISSRVTPREIRASTARFTATSSPALATFGSATRPSDAARIFASTSAGSAAVGDVAGSDVGHRSGWRSGAREDTAGVSWTGRDGTGLAFCFVASLSLGSFCFDASASFCLRFASLLRASPERFPPRFPASDRFAEIAARLASTSSEVGLCSWKL